MSQKLKGVVLAAGFGKRLMPLTEVYPKPLVPFAGSTPLELALWRLKSAGIEDNAVNSHHLAAKVGSYAESNPLGLKLKISHEPEILGTGGAYNPLRLWQGSSDLVVINGDVVSTVDIPALIAAHKQAGAIATMALLPEVIAGESGVFHQGGRVVGIGRQPPKGFEGARAANYACVQVVTPAFLDLLPKSGSFDVIAKGYQVALERGLPIASFIHTGFWHDLRTPSFYWQALKELLTGSDAISATGVVAVRSLRKLKTTFKNSVLSDDSSRIGSGVRMERTVIVEPGSKIGDHARLSEVLVLPGATIAAGEVIENSIIGQTLRIALQ